MENATDRCRSWRKAKHPSENKSASLSKRPSNRFWPNDNLEFRCLATWLMAGEPKTTKDGNPADTKDLESNPVLKYDRARICGFGF